MVPFRNKISLLIKRKIYIYILYTISNILNANTWELSIVCIIIHEKIWQDTLIVKHDWLGKITVAPIIDLGEGHEHVASTRGVNSSGRFMFPWYPARTCLVHVCVRDPNCCPKRKHYPGWDEVEMTMVKETFLEGVLWEEDNVWFKVFQFDLGTRTETVYVPIFLNLLPKPEGTQPKKTRKIRFGSVWVFLTPPSRLANITH